MNEIADLRKTPYGSAIIWKIKNLEEKDWDVISTNEIAIAIKEGLNMADFAKDYNVKLKKK